MAPVVFFEGGKCLFDVSCGVGLDEANHGADTHLWWYRNEKVDVVNVMVRLFEVELWVMMSDLDEFRVEIFPELIGNDPMTVFGRKDYVVVTEVCAVIVSPVLSWRSHTSDGSMARRS